MPIAAVPEYLGDDFKDASPGLRFGMYLAVWGVDQRTRKLLWTTSDTVYRETQQNRRERDMKEENKARALKSASALGEKDRHLLAALARRQLECLAPGEQNAGCIRFDAVSVSPFTTGLGNEHPLENGFSFLNPYGLPYLPGSGVKGVLRQAARELSNGEWEDGAGWSPENRWPIPGTEDAPLLSALDVLFGRESKDGSKLHFQGVLSFWDVIPQLAGDSLSVEVMTPHQTHYYQNGEAPHDSGAPNPINYLTVPPGSRFTFCVTCDWVRLRSVAPDLAEGDLWKQLLASAFKHAFEWCGFGAKTAVGYGAMRLADAVCEQSSTPSKKSAAGDPEAELAGLSAEERELAELRLLLEKDRKQGRPDPAGELSKKRSDLLRNAKSWESPELRRKAADLIQETVAWVDWPKKKRDERNREIEELWK